jgi:hypothetical protein
VQVECQESCSFNRLNINHLDHILELVQLGQIGLALFRDMAYADENRRDEAVGPREGQVVPTLCRSGRDNRVTIACDRALLILPVVLLHCVSYKLWDRIRNQSQPKSATIHAPASHSSAVDSYQCEQQC